MRGKGACECFVNTFLELEDCAHAFCTRPFSSKADWYDMQPSNLFRFELLKLSFVKSHYGSKMCERQILRRISRLLALIQIRGILHSQFSNIFFVKYSLSIGGVGKVISNWKYWCTHVGYLLIILI